MACENDIPGDFSTTAVLVPGETFLSNHDPECGDTDFFRADVQEGYTYRVGAIYINRPWHDLTINFDLLDTVNNTTVAAYGGYDSQFVFISRSVFFRPRYTGSYFVDTTRDLPVLVEYHLTLNKVQNDTHSPNNPLPQDGTLDITAGRFMLDELEVVGDTDVFEFQAIAGRRYELRVLGADGGNGTLADPWVGTWIEGQSLWDDNSGSGNNATLVFDVPVSRDYYVTIGGSGTGTFRVELESIDDFATGTGTDARLEIRGAREGTLDNVGDIDWFRVGLNQGNWYRFELDGKEVTGGTFDNDVIADWVRTPILIMRDPDLNVIDVDVRSDPATSQKNEPGDTRLYIFAEQTGDHYAIARSLFRESHAGYEITAVPVRAPIFRKYQNEYYEANGTFVFLSVNGDPINVADVFHHDGFVADEYQVFSQISLARDGIPQPGGQVHTIPTDEIQLWQANEAFNGYSDLFVRAKINNAYSRWQNTPIRGYDSTGLYSGQKWDMGSGSGPVQFTFAQGLPDYFNNVYSGFRIVAPNVDDNFSFEDQYYRLWGSQFIGFDATHNPETEIQIFFADNVDGYVDAFLPGDGSGGDLVLNSNYFQGFTTGEPLTGREVQELVRAIGTTVGLNEITDGSRYDTVMATAENPDAGPWVWGPMPLDHVVMEQIYGVEWHWSFGHQTAAPEADSLRTGGPGSYSDDHPFDVVLDLATGGVSYQIDENGKRFGQTVTDSDTHSANGDDLQFYGNAGAGNDLVLGNSRDNSLYGEGGGDWLNGRMGDDYLRGGIGNDYYGYAFGGGDDRISDADYPYDRNFGIDTVRLIGFGPFEVELHDLTFRRLGNDLRIELSLDDGPSEGTLTIENMALGRYRVESLEIFFEQEVNQSKISLFNLFGQLADSSASKFQTIAGSDRYGSLVARPFKRKTGYSHRPEHR